MGGTRRGCWRRCGGGEEGRERSGSEEEMSKYLLLMGILVGLSVLGTSSKKRQHRGKSGKPEASGENETLIPCEDCGNLVSRRAKSCPHCGAPLEKGYAERVCEKRAVEREEERKADQLKQITRFVVVAALVMAWSIALGAWMAFGAILLCFCAVLLVWWMTRNKGKVGEMAVGIRLAAGLPKEEYTVLNDIYLPLAEGGTTQIDHVVVSPYGVFVVETKNLKGWIFGDAKAPTWTQVVFHKKSTFQNPIRQNYLHVCAIAENLGLPKECMKGIVVFAGDCEFKTPMLEGVVEAGRLTAYIKGFQEELFDKAGMKEIVKVLKEWDASVSRSQRRAHVENLKKRHGGRSGEANSGVVGG